MVTMSMHSDMDTLCPLYGGCTSVKGSAASAPVSASASVSASVSKPPSAPHKVKDHCSVIVKLVPGTADVAPELFTAHTTWTGFHEMLRIYKLYDFPYKLSSSSPDSPVVPGRKISMSGYPGNLFSTDDWYTLSSGLASTETTISSHNEAIWDEVKPETVLTWLRTMVSNRLADSGPSWAEYFSMHNSGTYNNEFHVVDYNVFSEASSQTVSGGEVQLLPNTLTIIDQMPGHMEVSDETNHLQSRGYWASYNRPGLPYTWKHMNYTATVAAYGPHYSHKLCSRGQLFDILHSTIVDEPSLKAAMRWNQWDNDEIPAEIRNQMCDSGPSASNAISERGDLTKVSSNCADDVDTQNEGGIDMKYTTAALMARAKASTAEGGMPAASIAQSGPTYDDQPVFVWSESPFPEQVHTGMPDRWEFPYVKVDWSGE